MRSRPGRALLVLAAMLGACAPELHLNDIQVIGTHNSYKRAIDPVLFLPLAAQLPGLARSLDYEHGPLPEQLDHGVRQLELDVYYDPHGGRFAHPAVLDGLHKAGLAPSEPFDPNGELLAPGFKVLHRPDIDFRSTCSTLQRCLQAIRGWSSAHPTHVPIVIAFNIKDELRTAHDPPEAPALDSEAWNALDREIVSAVGREHMITPDDVRGDHETLDDAVLAEDWPALDDARGKLLFVLDETEEKMASYAAGHASLRGRALFLNVVEGRAESAIRILNEPIEQHDYIHELVEQGYLVRTRADADTAEARTGDTRRRDAAFDSGAHMVSTDYELPDKRFGKGYSVQLPGGGIARCNPVRLPSCRIDE
jgi:hypothetical protein